jgi:hypothetical protein
MDELIGDGCAIGLRPAHQRFGARDPHRNDLAARVPFDPSGARERLAQGQAASTPTLRLKKA